MQKRSNIAAFGFCLGRLLVQSYYFAQGKGAKYCDLRVCMCVCGYLCSDISQTTCSNLTKFSVHVTCAVAVADKVLGWLAVCSEVQMICTWSS